MKLTCLMLIVTLITGCATCKKQEAQTSPEQALNSCMKDQMALGAIAGGVIGAVAGIAVTKRTNKSGHNANENALMGAAAGAALGAAIAWRTSWASCTKCLKLATASSLKTDDYKNTAQRYDYQGKDSVLKIESANIPSEIHGGEIMKTDIKFALLIPEALETDVKVRRIIACENKEISNTLEQYKISPGTISSAGEIQIAGISNDVGKQKCNMKFSVAAAGIVANGQGDFVLLPGGATN